MAKLSSLSEALAKFVSTYEMWRSKHENANRQAAFGKPVAATDEPKKESKHMQRFSEYGSSVDSASDFDLEGTVLLSDSYTGAMSYRTYCGTVAVHWIVDWATRATQALEFYHTPAEATAA
jgi:hypothetical protein